MNATATEILRVVYNAASLDGDRTARDDVRHDVIYTPLPSIEHAERAVELAVLRTGVMEVTLLDCKVEVMPALVGEYMRGFRDAYDAEYAATSRR